MDTDTETIEALQTRIKNLRAALYAIAEKKDINYCMKNQIVPYPRRCQVRLRTIAQIALSSDNLYD